MGIGWLLLLSAVLCGSLFVGRIDGAEGCKHFVRMPMVFTVPYKNANDRPKRLSGIAEKSKRLPEDKKTLEDFQDPESLPESIIFAERIPIACFNNEAWERRKETVPLLQKALGLVGKTPAPQGQERAPNAVGKLLTSEITSAKFAIGSKPKLRIEICIKDNFRANINEKFNNVIGKRKDISEFPTIYTGETPRPCFIYKGDTALRLLNLILDEESAMKLRHLAKSPDEFKEAAGETSSEQKSCPNNSSKDKVEKNSCQDFNKTKAACTEFIKNANDALKCRLTYLPVKLVPKNCEYEDVEDKTMQLYKEPSRNANDQALFRTTEALLSLTVNVDSKEGRLVIANLDPKLHPNVQDKIVQAMREVYSKFYSEVSQNLTNNIQSSSSADNQWKICFTKFDDTLAQFRKKIFQKSIGLDGITFTKDYCITIPKSDPSTKTPVIELGKSLLLGTVDKDGNVLYDSKK